MFTNFRWADRQEAPGADGETRKFNHPFVQACVMFSGEILCLITFNLLYYYYNRRQVILFTPFLRAFVFE